MALFGTKGKKERMRSLYRAMKKDKAFQRIMKSKYPGYSKPGMFDTPLKRHTYCSIYFGYLVAKQNGAGHE